MEFVDLSRTFIEVKNEEHLDWETALLGKQYGGWLGWPELLAKNYIIVLAEAGSGKTEELRNQVKHHQKYATPAFYLTVQSVAERGIERSLNPSNAEHYRAWREGDQRASFFIDSIDEAKLSYTDIEQCLNTLAHDLGAGLPRCQIVFSCRGSDWEWTTDPIKFNRLLEGLDSIESNNDDDYNALISPIFNEDQHDSLEDKKIVNSGFFIVAMTSLDEVQQKKLVEYRELQNTDAFFHELRNKGLTKYADRPKDLLDLVEYWNANKGLGSRRQIIESTVKNKLNEFQKSRKDQSYLSVERAWLGAEILAAAMVFGKTTSLTSDIEASFDLTNNHAIDPRAILKDWTEDEISTLLRRGVFAPSTFGRLRFHHRETQEYLAACWIKRIQDTGISREKIASLFFASIYGSKTLIPSRRPTIAWLANLDPSWIIPVRELEPLVLLQHGDPGSLRLNDKIEMLKDYAQKHSEGEIGDDGIGSERLWMFADNDLASTILEVWDECDQLDFRLDLIRLIAEGEVKECKSHIINLVNDEAQPERIRRWALDTSEILGTESERKKFSRVFLANINKISNASAVSFTRSLYPAHLSTKELFQIIETVPLPERATIGGFGYELSSLWLKCPKTDREQFVRALITRCFMKPFYADHYRISKQFRFLAKYVDPIVIDLLEQQVGQHFPDYLVQLLMVMERRDSSSVSINETQKKHFNELLASNWQVRRALLWADAKECRQEELKRDQINRYWQFRFLGRHLHMLTVADQEWLYEDIINLELSDDRQIALSAYWETMSGTKDCKALILNLKPDLEFDPKLIEMIDIYSTPYEMNEADKRHLKWEEKHKKQEEDKKNKTIAAWEQHKDELVGDPSILIDPNSRYHHLHWLLYWLSRAENTRHRDVIGQVDKLASVFSKQVQKNFETALSAHWRETVPKRPIRKAGGRINEKWVNIHAGVAVQFEIDQDQKKFQALSDQELRCAAQHLIYGQFHESIMALVNLRPDIALPLLKTEISREWNGRNRDSDRQLHDLTYFKGKKPNELVKHVLKLFLKNVQNAKCAELASRLLISDETELRQTPSTFKKLEENFWTVQSEDSPLSNDILACLFVCNFEKAIQTFKKAVNGKRGKKRQLYVESVIGGLFDGHHHGRCVEALKLGTPTQIYELAIYAHKHIKFEDDEEHNGSYRPGIRDYAETGRGTILSALRDKRSMEAYNLAVKFANQHPKHRHWMRKNASIMLERDSEQVAWTEDEFCDFALMHTQPIKYGSDLMKAVINTLNNIRCDWNNEDASPRMMVTKYIGHTKTRDEEALQQLSLEALKLRAKGRFHAHREPIVANQKEPDIIVSATSAPHEVAIEIKQADHYSLAELQEALYNQLIKKYLLPSSRKNGILLLLNTRDKTWDVPNQTKRVRFSNILSLLQQSAKALSESDGIESVEVFGIDLAS